MKIELGLIKTEELSNTDIGVLSITTLLLAILVIGLFRSRAFWFDLDFLIVTGHGLVLLFWPQSLLSFFTLSEKTDGVHMHLCHTLGVMLLYSAMLIALFKNHLDPTVITTMLWSKLVLACLMLLADTYFYSRFEHKGSVWKKEDLAYYLGMACNSVYLMGHVIHLARYNKWGGYPETFQRLNFHVRLDFLATFVFGLACLAYPQWMIKFQTTLTKFDEVHAHLTRLFGMFLLHSALVMGNSPKFLSEFDKVVLLWCRVVFGILLLVTQLCAQTWYSVFTSAHIYCGMAWAAMWTLNALSGYLFSRHGKLK